MAAAPAPPPPLRWRMRAHQQAAQPLVPPGEPLQVTVVAGPLLSEVRQVWASWGSVTTRLWAGAGWLEQEWTVGPIPTADGRGREVAVRTSTSLATGARCRLGSSARGCCWLGAPASGCMHVFACSLATCRLTG